MKLYFTLFLLALSLVSFTQTSKDPVVLLTAVANFATPSITLNWKSDNAANYFAIYRKSKEANVWDSITKVDKTVSSYIDLSVATGKTYEYRVIKRTNGIVAVGYALTGINVLLPANRGKMILLVDKNYSAPLALDIARLENDLRGDGWIIIRHDVNRTDAVTAVKQLIVNDFNADKQNVKSVYILGHIPVPYAGGFTVPNLYPPDGHTDHVGAWPSDLYYGVMNESIWTDNSFTDTSGSRVQNRNKPGDGKFDIATPYPDTVTLQIGRVDLFNMPAFSSNDTLLIKRYLAKAHNFKIGINVGERRGYVSDNFGYMAGEAFASSGWRAMTPMFGDSVFPIGGSNFFNTLKLNSAQFIYGCGGGSYTSCGGIGTSSNFASDSVLYNFGMLFGSYFGDWDAQDNFLRAPLASKGWALSNSWSGRPYHFYHQMAMGENLGYCILKSQNNYPTYTYNIYPTFVYNSLMGDPSLRMNPIKPVSNLVLSTSTDKKKVTITWTASTEPGVIGYEIYRAPSKNAPFVLSGAVGSGITSYTENGPYNNLNYFMVKAVKFETTKSGTYINTSIGIIDTISASNSVGISLRSNDGFAIYPNPANNVVHLKYEFSNDLHYQVTIYDISGKALLSQVWNNNSSDEQIDISKLSHGIYLIKITNGAELLHTEKLIKL